MAQWLRIHLAMQGKQVQSLVKELRSNMPQSNQACTPLQRPCVAMKDPVCHN